MNGRLVLPALRLARGFNGALGKVHKQQAQWTRIDNDLAAEVIGMI